MAGAEVRTLPGSRDRREGGVTSADASPGPPFLAYRRAMEKAGTRLPALAVIEVEGQEGSERPPAHGTPLPRRTRIPLDPATLVTAALTAVEGGGPVFVEAPVPFLVGDAFPTIVRSLVAPRSNVKLVGRPAASSAPGLPQDRPARDDVASMRSLPGITVVAPADAPTTGEAVAALADRSGPAYLRLPPPGAPPITDGSFVVGRAHELHSGSDLAIVALGPMVGPALDLAVELERVGVSARVLDVASVKPFDEGAVLRAARDTGALLVLEAAPLADGVGTLVAALTAENHPVPVRRLGLPEVLPSQEVDPRLLEDALSLERARDEAFELLRLRGKIT